MTLRNLVEQNRNDGVPAFRHFYSVRLSCLQMCAFVYVIQLACMCVCVICYRYGSHCNVAM